MRQTLIRDFELERSLHNALLQYRVPGCLMASCPRKGTIVGAQFEESRLDTEVRRAEIRVLERRGVALGSLSGLYWLDRLPSVRFGTR